jgi:hypothetical protein
MRELCHSKSKRDREEPKATNNRESHNGDAAILVMRGVPVPYPLKSFPTLLKLRSAGTLPKTTLMKKEREKGKVGNL